MSLRRGGCDGELGIALGERGRQSQHWFVFLAAVGAGVMLGGVNSLSNVLGSPYSPHALRPDQGVFFLEVLAAVLGTAWAWALTAFSVGWWSGTTWRAPLAGFLVLAVAAVVYYASDFAFGLNTELETGEMARWAAIALVVGPAMATAGSFARSWRRWSLIPGLAAPTVIAMTNYSSGSDHIQPWPQRVGWFLAIGLTTALVLRWMFLWRKSMATTSLG